MTTKKSEIEQLISQIGKGFEEWDALLDKMGKLAETAFMPLLQDSFVLSKKILLTYKESFQLQANKQLKKK